MLDSTSTGCHTLYCALVMYGMLALCAVCVVMGHCDHGHIGQAKPLEPHDLLAGGIVPSGVSFNASPVTTGMMALRMPIRVASLLAA